MSPFVAGLIVGILVTAATVGFAFSITTLRRTAAILERIRDPRPTDAELAAEASSGARPTRLYLDEPVREFTFTNADVTGMARAARSAGAGRHGATEVKAPAHRQAPPESAVERTHAMPPVRPQPRRKPSDNPTGLDTTLLADALNRGVTRPAR